MAGVVLQPIFNILVGGQDVTNVLTPYLIEVGYVDHEEGEADSVDIRLDNSDGRFMGAWRFKKGQTVELSFGYVGGVMRRTGAFDLDEIEFDGPPDVATVRALGVGVSHAYRTHAGKSYEGTTLAGVAQQVAKRLKLRLVGQIEPIPIRRVTQIYESDLAFLHRLAAKYGYAFSVRGTVLSFVKRSDLRASKAVLSLDKSDVSTYRIKDKLKDVPKSATVAWHDPKTKRVKHYKVVDTGGAASADELKINSRVESDTQAKAEATAAMQKAAEDAVEAEITLFGAPEIVAGCNFDLTGLGHYAGAWHALRTRHRSLRGDGYKTIIEARKVVAHGA